MSDANTPQPRVIWTSMLFAPVVYTTMGLTLLRTTEATVTPVPLLPIFAAAAFVLAVAAFMLRGRLADAPSDMLPNDPRRAMALVKGAIIPWALDEMIAVLGLVLILLGRPPLQWLPFCAASFALLLLHAPPKEP